MSSGHGSPGTITIHSMGGLGNQLFIYALGISVASHHGVPLRIDASLHVQDPSRPFRLRELGFPGEYVPLEARPRRRRRRAADPPKSCSFRERGFTFQQAALDVPAGSCLFGYFQSWRYLLPVEQQLRAQFGRLLDDRSRNAALRMLIEKVTRPGTVVAHVRRGDYLRAGALKYHGLAGAEYYGRAVAVLRRMGHEGPVLVLSDEPARARGELAVLPGVEVLEPDGLDDVDELLLMSQAPALITANSSFSWWAAWIGDHEDRPVVCPDPWFEEPGNDARDLLPPSWLTLKR